MVLRRRPVALVGLLAAALTLTGACTDDVAPSASHGRTDGFERPGMHAIDPPPIGDRHGEVRVLADGRLLIWGGQSAESSMTGITFGDGVVLDVGTGEWTDVADAPFPHGLYSPAAAFDGTEVVVVGTECDEQIPAPTTGEQPQCAGPAAAAWNPSEDRWRRLPAPPIDPVRDGVPHLASASPAVGVDGHAVFVDGLSGSTIRWDRDGERWESIAPPFDDWAWYCADPSAPWVVAVTREPEDGAWRSAVLRPGEAKWSTAVVADRALGPIATCGGRRVVSSSFDGRTSEVGIFDPVSGTNASAIGDVPSGRVAEATATGRWMFVQTTSMPEIVGTTTTALDPASGDAEQRSDGRTMTVQLLPQGRPVAPRTDSNLYTLTSPWSTYVEEGIVICDLARPDECRMWVPPAEATPD